MIDWEEKWGNTKIGREIKEKEKKLAGKPEEERYKRMMDFCQFNAADLMRSDRAYGPDADAATIHADAAAAYEQKWRAAELAQIRAAKPPREPIAERWSEQCQAQSRRAASDASNTNNTNTLRR